jgi:hypothetical protein
VISLKSCKNVNSFLAFFDKGKGSKIVPPHAMVTRLQCLTVCTTKAIDPQSLWSENLRWKREGCHIKLLLPTYSKLRRSLFTLGKCPSRWKLVCDANVVSICWVLMEHINLVLIAIHSTWVVYSRTQNKPCNVQSAKRRCLIDSINCLAFLVKYRPGMISRNGTSLLTRSPVASWIIQMKFKLSLLRILHWRDHYW